MRTVLCILLLSILSIAAGNNETYSQSGTAVKGILDLRNKQLDKDFIMTINGEWSFYWKRMLYPYHFKGKSEPVPDFYAKVPAYWTDYSGNNIKTEKYGYATYNLKILLPEGFKSRLAFDVPVFDSSFDLWLNDSLYFYNGHPDVSEELTEPGYSPGFFAYSPRSDTINIIINVANYHHRRGGFWLPLKFGTFFSIQKDKAKKWAANYAVLSLIAGFAIFFLIFFLLYPKDRLLLFFSIGLAGIAIRPLFTSVYLINDFLNFSWDWIVRCEYLSLFIIVIGWVWYIKYLYPSLFINLAAWFFTFLFLCTTILTLFLPVRIFSYSTFPFYVAVLVLLVYSLVMSLPGTLKRKFQDVMFFSAFIMLTIGVVHDILISLGKAHFQTGYIMTFIVVLFIFIQAVMLLYKWVRAYYEKEKLQAELKYLNRNLEEMINKRTRELKERNKEIENQSNKIALQNQQLTETIQLKNRLFSVIAHDLRSPVVNILYMLNLLKEPDYRDKQESFTNSSIQYAQMVISLLENMLAWGRGQEEKIKYSPEYHDLASIILTNLSIFKESSDRKDISVNFTQRGNSTGYFDKDLLDIVIRNLLSNAVKYTHRGGRISILVKEKTSGEKGLMLKICYNGVGISQQKQDELFSRTEIESTPGTENEKGTGLGLKLCYELIQINMGMITVESKESEGTCFIIDLPNKKASGT